MELVVETLKVNHILLEQEDLMEEMQELLTLEAVEVVVLFHQEQVQVVLVL